MNKTIISVGFSVALSCLNMFAKDDFATVKGSVFSTADSTAVDYASVLLSPSQIYTMSDKDGNFLLKEVPAGKITLSVQFYGMEQIDTTFSLTAGQTLELSLGMTPTSFRLDNVVVTATQNKAGSSTASNISRQAMDHMQTGSLKDIMALLPGMEITNPSLSKAQNITIRSLNVTGSSSSMNSLGTAVIVDGAPISNNANLQVLSPTQSGTMTISAGGAATDTGIDVRGISTDNIESVEVIRGIPSAEYGDMTSGAVIVKSRAGKTPLMVRFKTNPNIYQASVTKGFGLGKKAGDLNISADYAYNMNELTKSFSDYQRANVKALWSVIPGGGIYR